jgi:class 3 adenylate cyclase
MARPVVVTAALILDVMERMGSNSLSFNVRPSEVMELAFLAFRNRVSDHAQPAIEMAMAVQCHLETMRAEHPELRLRIGIHAGPVVAGVIRR